MVISNIINHAINESDVIYRINETFETHEVSRVDINGWLADTVADDNIPTYIWDIINAVYHNSEDISVIK